MPVVNKYRLSYLFIDYASMWVVPELNKRRCTYLCLGVSYHTYYLLLKSIIEYSYFAFSFLFNQGSPHYALIISTVRGW